MRVLIVAALLLASPAAAEDEKSKKLEVAYELTWKQMPSSCRFKKYGTVKLDRTKRGDYELPVDLGEEAFRVGRLRAHTLLCGLKEENVGVLCAFLKKNEKRLSPRQVMFARELTLTTVELLTGDVRVGDKVVKAQPKPCTPDIKKKVKAVADMYLKEVPGWKKGCAAMLPTKCVR